MTQEQRALLVVCPVCRAGVQEKCFSQSAGSHRWHQRTRARIKRPHRERIEKARNNDKPGGVDRSDRPE